MSGPVCDVTESIPDIACVARTNSKPIHRRQISAVLPPQQAGNSTALQLSCLENESRTHSLVRGLPCETDCSMLSYITRVFLRGIQRRSLMNRNSRYSLRAIMEQDEVVGLPSVVNRGSCDADRDRGYCLNDSNHQATMGVILWRTGRA